jgi:uncharacterized protein (DUF2062 family)
MSGSPPSPPRRTFWQRWLTDPILHQLTQGVSPEKIALTLAVGSALALFPILGTTTLLCLAAGVILSLNQPILQAINILCGFIWIPLLVAFIRLGDRLTGHPSGAVDLPRMMALARHHPGGFLREFGVTALHAVLGWAATAPLWIPLVYLVVRGPLRAAAERIGRRRGPNAGA